MLFPSIGSYVFDQSVHRNIIGKQVNAFAAQLFQKFLAGGIDIGNIRQFDPHLRGIRMLQNILATRFEFIDPNGRKLSFQDNSDSALIANCDSEHGPFSETA
jgi:hypothetical protein